MIATRTIGSSGIEVSELSFGGAPLGAVGDRISADTAAAIVQRAHRGGIRYFDTAPLYGHGLSEKRLGATLRTLPRDDFVLSTKVGRLLVPEAEGERYAGMRDAEPVAIRYDYSYDAVRRSLEASLERLGLDRVDILLCHDIDVWTHGDAQPGIFDAARNGALSAMRALREDGVVGAIGLGVNEWQVCSRVMDEMDVDCFLLAGRFTLLEQEPSAGEREGPAPRMKEPSAREREGPAPRMKEPSAGVREGPAPRMKEPSAGEREGPAPRMKEPSAGEREGLAPRQEGPLDTFLPKCVERNVSVIIGGPYNSGILATDDRRRATYDYKPAPEHLWQKAQAIRRMCESHGVDPRAAALQYPLRHPAVAAVIPGVWAVEEVETNLGLIGTEIPDALWRDLAAAGLARAID